MFCLHLHVSSIKLECSLLYTALMVKGKQWAEFCGCKMTCLQSLNVCKLATSAVVVVYSKTCINGPSEKWTTSG